MRRIRSVVLIVCFIALSACGVEDVNNIKGNITSIEDEENIVTEDNGKENEVNEAELSIGQMEGGIYTNEYIGIACKLDTSWTYMTAVELEDNLSLTQDAIQNLESLKGTAIEEAIGSNTHFYDMKAKCENDMTSISILYEKLSIQSRVAVMGMTDEQFVKGMISETDTLVKAYEEMGLEDVKFEVKTIDYLEDKQYALLTSAKVQGIDYYCLQIQNYRLGQYGVTITLTSYLEDKTEELAKIFYKLEK